MATSVRRSGNYPPSLWSYDHIQSLNSKYTGEKHMPKLHTLKEAVRAMIYKDNENVDNPFKILGLVDDLQRLGVAYHFEDEIRKVLKNIFDNYYKSPENWTKMDLNLKSLGFRVLRQHGYHVPQEIFEDIKDNSGNFKGELQKDIIGMLNLYEASYHSLEDEHLLDDARDFTTKYLKQSLENIADQHLSSLWEDLCKAYLIEAKWYNSGYTPTLEEYLENAWVSISVPLMLTHISYLTSTTPTEEIMHSMERIENIIRYSGIILRLADDLGTYSDEMARGDNPKAVQCYMHETGATEEEARMYVTTLILNTCKKLNKERSSVLDSQILKELTDCGANLGRMAQFMYYDEDGHGSRPDVTKSHVLSLLVNPI
ncbi:hypothetical protein M8C21_001842 [Ambrosia artemisiifolia]|uniref:Terpene synthase N-terminal domain-containing protein n=1 Tax=Ambrosia artemisiifolia TaxID=4212 RepID=A0AAD5GLR1_AMBAR|nr:hypothetical protein M8C21_001842 [Ambrosia artemisiifolia]